MASSLPPTLFSEAEWLPLWCSLLHLLSLTRLGSRHGVLLLWLVWCVAWLLLLLLGGVVGSAAGGGGVEGLLGLAVVYHWFFDHPIEHEVVFEALGVEKVLEELAEVPDVGLFFEFEGPAVAHVELKFLGHAFCELVDLGAEFLVPNLLILLFLGPRGQPLPRQLTLVKVDEDESEAL